ncbi:murein biosynthesis integral membrane protein MurJ [Hypericibacter sp.]|uniref:murein biosynthesis integral membrane protein MurJ n=1 Tax=Hypericibacter sp. TaxID=2705401 RepID=UPI003D6D2568
MALIGSIVKVGSLTGVSRAGGFLRDILIAHALGTGPIADAFFVAMRFPNLFRQMFAEGAFNAAFVPMFAGKLEQQGPAAAKAFAERVLSVLLFWLLLFTIAAQFAMPWLMWIIAPGFTEDPVKFGYAVQFTQVTFPYLLFMSLTALQGGILNSLHRFGAPAAAPILLNVVMAGALIFIVPFTGRPGLVLAWSVAASGLCQFIWLVFSCNRAGMALSLPMPRLDPEIKRLLKLMVPGLLSGGVTQINIVVGTIIATSFPAAVSYLYYADRVFQLPLGVIGAAVGVVLLPTLTRSLRAGRHDIAMHNLNRCIEFSMTLIIPATMALLAIPVAIMTTLFERGAFDADASRSSAWALAAFAAGLPAFALVKAFAPCFFAREDTTTPFRVALIAVLTNVVLSVGLSQTIGFVGIPIATTLATTLNATLLGVKLFRLEHFVMDERLKRRLPRIFLASLGMTAILLATTWAIDPFIAAGGWLRLIMLVVLVTVGLFAYAGLGLLFGAFARSDFSKALSRKKGAAPAVTPATTPDTDASGEA